MGVHDLKMYPAVKKLLDIPQDEPIFILRAQDILSTSVLVFYQEQYKNLGDHRRKSVGFYDRLSTEIEDRQLWRDEHLDSVKVPD